MRIPVLFALAALIPAACNTSPAAARGITVPLCAGDGLTRTVTIPVSGGELPGKDMPGCCAKACHTGSRKKCGLADGGGEIDSEQ
ncbi:hypothetical protein H7F51_08900 [Novosphingobium flavum]|uniref:Uncharacterized protein n=1 Tax=Novosphingobium flavum TaxID=1778672 RepID=A0A7X1FRI2_9SPHN|nr:hypothetical protein [Novosphingobium flavum]MBC2665641.1 hypothetical protein [Novosphingobium flavum]